MRTIIIAEAANNHDGDLETAKKMVQAAAEAGADFIKFQAWQLKKLDPLHPTYEGMKGKELTVEDQKELIQECKNHGIKFLTACFDIDLVEPLADCGIEHIKVGSPDINSYSMLKKLRNNFKHMFVSTGMAKEEEVKNAIEILKEGDFTILHCVALYPTPDEKANINRMEWLKQFTPHVGYSDHTVGTEACKIAISKGAKVVEKHFTLERDENHPPSWMSALPHEIKEICDFRDKHDKMVGSGTSAMQEGEEKSRDLFMGRWGDNR